MNVTMQVNTPRIAAADPIDPTPVQETREETMAPVRDEAVISPQGQEAQETEGSRFPSFAEVFAQITQGYTQTVREFYARETEENQSCDNPEGHIWDKYKNPDSPHFRSDLSEAERAWAYDQELDLLSGGNHLQLRNPYAFPEGAPTLSDAALQGLRTCREGIDRSIQALLREKGVEVPADAAFRLTADPSDYSIRVRGLEDEDLTAAIEEALNGGENGKVLYQHLQLTAGDVLEITYTQGRLEELNPETTLDDAALEQVKRQAGPVWARYSETYNPRQKAMNETLLTLNPDSPLNTPERLERMSAAVRVGAPELLAEFRARQQDLSLVAQEYREVDPDGSIAAATYVRAYAQTAETARNTILAYYQEAHLENSSYPLLEGLEHIAEKYLRPESALFRGDLSEDRRAMYCRQERALLTEGRVTLLDPYALESIGGILTVRKSHQLALQAVREKLQALKAGA